MYYMLTIPPDRDSDKWPIKQIAVMLH